VEVRRRGIGIAGLAFRQRHAVNRKGQGVTLRIRASQFNNDVAAILRAAGSDRADARCGCPASARS
jgi:hypothetical protein